MQSPEKFGSGRKLLTQEEHEERRLARNARKREKYAIERDRHLAQRLEQFLLTLPHDARDLVANVIKVRHHLTGRLKAEAEYIILMWKEGSPRRGWQEDAREIIAAAGGQS